MRKANVLIISVDPSLINFLECYEPYRKLNEATLCAAQEHSKARLNQLGFETELCLIDLEMNAASVITHRLQQTSFDCIMIEASLRLNEQSTLLFEEVMNILHVEAPKAVLSFNTHATNMAEAVQRSCATTEQAFCSASGAKPEKRKRCASST